MYRRGVMFARLPVCDVVDGDAFVDPDAIAVIYDFDPSTPESRLHLHGDDSPLRIAMTASDAMDAILEGMNTP